MAASPSTRRQAAVASPSTVAIVSSSSSPPPSSVFTINPAPPSLSTHCGRPLLIAVDPCRHHRPVAAVDPLLPSPLPPLSPSLSTRRCWHQPTAVDPSSPMSHRRFHHRLVIVVTVAIIPSSPSPLSCCRRRAIAAIFVDPSSSLSPLSHRLVVIVNPSPSSCCCRRPIVAITVVVIPVDPPLLALAHRSRPIVAIVSLSFSPSPSPCRRCQRCNHPIVTITFVLLSPLSHCCHHCRPVVFAVAIVP